MEVLVLERWLKVDLLFTFVLVENFKNMKASSNLLDINFFALPQEQGIRCVQDILLSSTEHCRIGHFQVQMLKRNQILIFEAWFLLAGYKLLSSLQDLLL